MALGFAGLAVMGVGIGGSAGGWDLDGVTPFLVVGAVLLALAVLYPQIESLNVEAAGAKVGLLLRRIASDSSPAVLEELERLGVADLAVAYEFVHDALSDEEDKNTRIRLQDQLVDMAEQRAFDRDPDKKLLNAAIESHSAAGRAIAIGFAKRHPELVTLDAMETVILHSMSGNEQYHALLLAKKVLPTLKSKEAQALMNLINEAKDEPYVRKDSERMNVVDAINREFAPRHLQA